MKKLLNLSFIYAILAMVGGVFYREFTKLLGFSGRTTLAFVHVHLLALGTLLFLILALFARGSHLAGQKCFRTFCALYNVALPLMVLMLVVRGVTQALQTPLSPGIHAAISGVAGISHILLAVSLFLMFSALKKCDVFGKQRNQP